MKNTTVFLQHEKLGKKVKARKNFGLTDHDKPSINISSVEDIAPMILFGDKFVKNRKNPVPSLHTTFYRNTWTRIVECSVRALEQNRAMLPTFAVFLEKKH